MENWMVSLGVALAGSVAMFAVLKANVKRLVKATDEQAENLVLINKFVNEKRPLLDYLSKSKKEVVRRLDNQRDDLTALKEKSGQSPSMRDVREEFVTKEIFRQMQNHFDDRFKRIEDGLSKILTKLEK